MYYNNKLVYGIHARTDNNNPIHLLIAKKMFNMNKKKKESNEFNHFYFHSCLAHLKQGIVIR